MAINGVSDRSRIFNLVDPDGDDGLEWDSDVDRGSSTALFFGPEFEPTSPLAVVFHLEPGSADKLRAMHVHGADAVNLVLAGSMKMDNVWLTPGMAKCTPAGVAYGDAEVGPDGVTFIEFLSARSGVQQTYQDPDLQAEFEAHPHHRLTRLVAMGAIEADRVRPGLDLDTIA
jgi:hypothetical protein